MFCRQFERKKLYKRDVDLLPVEGKSDDMFVMADVHQLENVILNVSLTLHHVSIVEHLDLRSVLYFISRCWRIARSRKHLMMLASRAVRVYRSNKSFQPTGNKGTMSRWKWCVWNWTMTTSSRSSLGFLKFPCNACAIDQIQPYSPIIFFEWATSAFPGLYLEASLAIGNFAPNLSTL